MEFSNGSETRKRGGMETNCRVCGSVYPDTEQHCPACAAPYHWEERADASLALILAAKYALRGDWQEIEKDLRARCATEETVSGWRKAVLNLKADLEIEEASRELERFERSLAENDFEALSGCSAEELLHIKELAAIDFNDETSPLHWTLAQKYASRKDYLSEKHQELSDMKNLLLARAQATCSERTALLKQYQAAAESPGFREGFSRICSRLEREIAAELLPYREKMRQVVKD